SFPHGGSLYDQFFEAPWIMAGDLKVPAGLMLDNLSAVMILVVTGIGFLIHVYSTAYIEHDEGYTRFFGYLNLFTGAMLILVLGDSMLVTFVGWEGVGLCSYLLIGFWFDKEANASAGRKAFVVNRIGDFAFLLAMFLLLDVAGTVRYGALANFREILQQPLWFGVPTAYYVGILVLIGATGKSAQIPLYVWLPDAMAGPTPVSALIHAATMVTAGVYVVTRLHFVFEIAPATLATVAVIGALTALFAATIGVAQRDLKKVLAYSTISQLGFMFVGVGSYLWTTGTSNYQAGVFHLVTHAFFKAGLFLGAGSVMHALGGEGDITRMGGLRKHLPHTRLTFLIYCLAIAGIFPFAGFWSKDAILAGAHAATWPASPHAGALELFFANHLGQLIYGVMLATAGLTAFYMFRLYFLVFGGEFRGTEEQKHHLHESPPAMTGVLWVLAIGSIGVGLLGIPDVVYEGADRFGLWLTPVVVPQARHEAAGEFWIAAAIAMAVSLAGIGLAWTLYGHGFSARVRSFVAALPRTYKLVLHKYYIDEIYDALIVRPLRWLAILLDAFDRFFIDMVLVNGTGMLIGGVGKLVKYIQNGDVQRYVIGILAGTTLLVLVAANWSVWNGRKFTVHVDGRVVEVDATRGASDKRLRYRVRWEGDKDFGPAQADNVFNHRFETPGKKKIAVEAIDPRWGTSWSEERKVEIK
ncbi:MAG TPA: NADH-quinone oxidoreductase subunit L, partial [Polyangia bacterium]|nr:NADH-quinone oxidoreductase subunit L [Polyangia bacterium]